MNIFLREMRANLKAFFVWVLVLVFFLGVGVAKFTGVAAGTAGGDQVKDILNAFPPIVRAMMGIGASDMSTFSGFYVVLEFYIGLIVAFYAVSLGRTAVNRDLTEKTYEFLYSKPRSRGFILTAKLGSAFAYLLVFCALNFVVSIGVVQSLDLDADPTALILRSTVWCGLIARVFLGVGAAIAGLLTRTESGTKWGNVAVLAAYVMTVLYDAFSDKAEWVRVFSPLRYITPDQLEAGEWSAGYVVLGCVLGALGIGLAYWRFTVRDLAERS